MDDAGNTKDDMKLPAEEELAKEARASLTQRCSHACASLATRAAVVLRAALTLPLALLQIKTGFDEGKELVVTVLKVSSLRAAPPRLKRLDLTHHAKQAMGEEAIHAVKEGAK